MEITLCSLSDIDKHKANHQYIIVRKLKNPVRGVVPLPELSPSEDLLEYALRNKDNPNWFETYESRFREEMRNPKFQVSIFLITEFLKRGESVTLACYCKDYKNCHRKLVGECFEKLGVKVNLY